MKVKHPVLFTRTLNAADIEYARLRGIEPYFKPAIDIVFPDYWDDILGLIAENQRASWIFTSQNAVMALQKITDNGLRPPPGTTIYAVGPKTRQKLEQLGMKAVIPNNYSAEHLAQKIVEEHRSDTVIYFQGNRSLSTLDKILSQNNIEVLNAEVYKTQLVDMRFPDRNFEAVVFYSPSAIKAFKQSGGFKQIDARYAAIGPTTAKALEKEVAPDIDVICPEKSDTRKLINTLAGELATENMV